MPEAAETPGLGLELFLNQNDYEGIVMEKTTTGKTTGVKDRLLPLLARPWQRLTALALALALAFAWMADLGEPWDTSAYANVYGMGDAASCIRFRAPSHDENLRYATNSCSYRVSVGYCLDVNVDRSRTVTVLCSDGRMNTCGAPPGAQCHGGMQLRSYDSFTWGACRNRIVNDDPENFECG